MLYKYISLIILFVLTILILPRHIAASQIKSYLITDEKEFYGTPLLNKVYFTKSLAIPYNSGRVVISSNPDGTGEALVGEELMTVSNYPVSDTFLRNNDCNGKMKPLDITHMMWTGSNSSNTNLTIQFRYNMCREFKTLDGVTKQYAHIGPLYIVNFEDDPGIEPFLDLPWDYLSQNNNFNDVAFKMFSFFDHEYPLLIIGKDSEPVSASDSLIQYNGLRTNKPYSSHDGYDYAFESSVSLGTPVVAPAAGIATFKNNCIPCGNAIFIDHQNGYQTRYYHLSSEGLVTDSPNVGITVADRQTIGKVGMTGNTDGPHIHFMVIHDKNGDGNFDDNIPDGLVDPYGWQSQEDDPWPKYTFNWSGKARTGSVSRWLWKPRLPKVTKKISPDNRVLISNGRYTADFNKGFLVHDTIFSSSYVGVGQSNSNLKVISPGIDMKVWDGIDTYFTTFKNFFTLITDFKGLDISRIIPETISLYSSTDGINWQKENTQIDMTTNKATAQLNHLTQFVLMGEKKDTEPPKTTIAIEGNLITETSVPTYESKIKISLTSQDGPNEDSLGVANTFYKSDQDDWQLYTVPFEIGGTGMHLIKFYSEDKDGNKETIQEKPFELTEISQPEFIISFDINKTGYILHDDKGHTAVKSTISEKNKKYDLYVISQGNKKISLSTKTVAHKGKTTIQLITLQYNNDPKITFSRNVFTTLLKNKQIQSQIYYVKQSERIRTDYNPKKNTTQIKEKGKKQIIVTGEKKIILKSNQGVINYSISE